ncbi:RING-H2 finger protein ATL66-like [Canna indica]|uniref:RING-H2 finger protein ATL66-like n=1 Tax=Canna indica TaxID=4628 RepID=A0AAQ3KWX7_9LILI|nr:RING-H2 finger protein ATL66-like [Canna indica]
MLWFGQLKHSRISHHHFLFPNPTQLTQHKPHPHPPPPLANSSMAAQGSQPFHWHYDELDDKNFHVRGRSLLFLIVFFAILLTSTLLCLYVRWACRHRRWAAQTDSSVMPSAAPPPRAAGLDAKIIDSIPVRLHQAPADGEEAPCSICLSGLTEREKVKVLPSCDHTFHVECVDEWLRAHTSCPLCRARLDKETV